MENFNHMNPPCPCCQRPLRTKAQLHENDFLAYCERGDCESELGDIGATGRTEKEACENLILKMQATDWTEETELRFRRLVKITSK